MPTSYEPAGRPVMTPFTLRTVFVFPAGRVAEQPLPTTVIGPPGAERYPIQRERQHAPLV
jgi:hypothetical protein